MIRHILISVSLLVSCYLVEAQQILNAKMDVFSHLEFGNLSFLNSEDVSFQFNLINGEFKQWSGALNFRLEDQLTSEVPYRLLKDITFFDLQFAYTLGAIQIGLFIENLLSFNNKQFDIEPNLERLFGVADTIFFTHEANFLIGSRISYNF